MFKTFVHLLSGHAS